ncbi:MAG: diguanylate cyclase [Edaphobacter sp.]|uniref:GGDEF domain-containing protein n=1 Tax=Edaphobacter sp. TaxID=1934404 RepID=UPI00239A3A88|nr:diguanylate cyclase [Edaphobacter sp.]MDE1175665.1 diguanylate cyclase [Edaphobacter sp.]
MKILVAEDEPVSRVLMQRMLRQFGYDVLIAEDGRKAAEILAQDDGPRLALIDWMMPELDGPDLCRKIRTAQQESSYVYIILLTSRQNSEDIVAGLESGADDYLVKPCAPAELKARLRTGRRILELQDKLVEAREQMRYKATYDSLTGLRNRAAILAFAHESLSRPAYAETVTLLMLCDVDHFKRMNDTYGHPTGDAVLEEIARRLNTAVGLGGAVGRYGGEEFLIVINDCSPSTMEGRCEVIREAISRTPIATRNHELPATISIGSILHESGNGDMPLKSLLAHADAALYRAKEQGRNCVVFAESMAVL